MCSKIKDSYKEELDKKLSTKGSRERLQTVIDLMHVWMIHKIDHKELILKFWSSLHNEWTVQH